MHNDLFYLGIKIKLNYFSHLSYYSLNMDIETIIKKYEKPVLSIAFRMMGNWEDARDVAQDAFIRFWQSKSRPEKAEAEFSYLARIVSNRCIDLLRKKKRFPLFLRAETVEVQSTEIDKTEQNEFNRILNKQIERLKPKQKAVFILRDLEGYSIRDTAEILNENENRVRVNLHLARKNLKKWLRPVLFE